MDIKFEIKILKIDISAKLLKIGLFLKKSVLSKLKKIDIKKIE